MTSEDKYKITILEYKIAQGDLDAMFEYACLYHLDYPNEITKKIAAKMVKYYETCYEAGNLTAALNLGAMYYGGEFIPRDFKKAFEYYTIATESDEISTKIRAFCNLGYCYYYGRDIPVDDKKAFNCYMHGAILNDANSLYKIGDMYRYGRFVEKDENLAHEFYKKARQNAYPDEDIYADVCQRIGECFLYGIGTEKDALKAFENLSKAEIYTYKKIHKKDPFAASLLPKIQKLLVESRKLLEEKFN